MDGAKLVIKDLAVFHAVPIALKLTKPDIFKTKVKKNCLKPFFPEASENQEFLPRSHWFPYIEQIDECKPYLEQVATIWDEISEDTSSDSYILKPRNEPFPSIQHGDMWCNNTMQKSEDGKLIKNKLIDFQI